MPRLTKINLRGNCCRNEGVEALGKWLSTNTTVTALNLNENNLGDNGGKRMAEMLKTNRTLKHLDLSLNYITNEAAKELAAALDVNQAPPLSRAAPRQHRAYQPRQLGQALAPSN